ncbi:recombinase family protein [Bacillus toyonensis]
MSSQDNEEVEAQQLANMLAEGIGERDIFVERIEGKSLERPVYKTLKGIMRKGDVIFLDNLARLGRNYEAILNEWKDIKYNIGADIVVLENKELFDSRKFGASGDAGKLIEDQFISFLSYVADTERTRMLKRQAEGFEQAKAAGKHLGRPQFEITDEFRKAYARVKAGEITASQGMEEADVKRTSWYKFAKQLDAEMVETSAE